MTGLTQQRNGFLLLNLSIQVRATVLLTICLAGLGFETHVLGQSMDAPASKVKATFLYNFTKLVTWPTNSFTSTNAPIVIGVLGKDRLGADLDQLKGLHSAGRTIDIARFTKVQEATNCQVLFISGSERRRLGPIMHQLEHQPVLTVGATRGFVKRGMIELVRSDDSFDLRINMEAASSSGLQLSSKLTRLDKRLRPIAITSTNAPDVSLD